ncbi:MAG: sigma-70 family RNA polymerase sigma factor [Planctomycetota bacterium]
MTARSHRSPRPAKGARVAFADLDALLDVPLSQYERNLKRVVRDFRAKGWSLEVPASQVLESCSSSQVTWPRLFEAQVRNLPRLDRAEEFRMARRYEFAKARVRDALQAAGYRPAEVDALVLRAVADLPPPAKRSTPAARAHLARCADELEQVRNLYVEGALYLVLPPVRRYRDLGVDEADLIQESNASLFQAIEGFDWRREVRFKTYAIYWIQQAILKTLYNASRTVRVPIWVQKAYRKIRQVQESKASDLGYLPPTAWIGEELDMPAERVEEILAVRRFAVSLDAQMSSRDEDGATLGQLLADDEAVPVHESVKEGDLEFELGAALAELPDRERMILKRRFGLGGGEPETLADIAQDLGVTAERVRQLQKAAIERLQKPAPMERLKIFD